MKELLSGRNQFVFCALLFVFLGAGCESPIITNVDPPAAYVGDEVSISALGFYLGFTQGDTTITFNGVDAGLAHWWNCYGGFSCDIRILVPEGAASGCIVLTEPIDLGPSECYPFTVLAPG